MSVYIPIHHDAFTGESWDGDALLDTREVLEVRLEDGEGAAVYVRFDDYLAYRKRDEGDAYRTQHEMKRTNALRIGLSLVEETEFLQWFGEECEHVRDVKKLKHFCLATLNSIIDVICFEEPEVGQIVGADQKA